MRSTHRMLAFALVAVSACREQATATPQTAVIPPAPDASSAPAKEDAATMPSSTLPIYDALIAYDMDAGRVGVVFVFLGEPATIAKAQKMQSYIVAREAYFEVAEDGRFPNAQPYTVFPPSGATCVGRAERKVSIRSKPDDTAPPKVERGLVLEGCPAPDGVYGMLVVPGAYPDAKKMDPSGIALTAAPPWAKGARAVHRFATTDPLFVAVRPAAAATEDEWVIGSATTSYGTILVQRNFDTPTLFDIDHRTFLRGSGVQVEVVAGSLVRVRGR